jgi:hypothetical protein
MIFCLGIAVGILVGLLIAIGIMTFLATGRD